MHVDRLGWDSDFFGMEVGRLILKPQIDITFTKRLLANSTYDVVYLFIEQPTDIQIEQIGAIAPLYDRKVTFRKKKCFSDAGQNKHEAVRYEEPLNDELLQLALMSGEYSRFKVDPKFFPYFKRLYAKWIEASLSGERGDVIYAVRGIQGLKGFVTLSNKSNVGQIGLIAVHPEARGQGVASALMRCAHEWYDHHGCVEAVVVTQRENVPACYLYKKNGYELDSETAIFHWWRS